MLLKFLKHNMGSCYFEDMKKHILVPSCFMPEICPYVHAMPGPCFWRSMLSLSETFGKYNIAIYSRVT